MILRGDGVEEFTTGGDTHVSEREKETTRQSETVVDTETVHYRYSLVRVWYETAGERRITFHSCLDLCTAY